MYLTRSSTRFRFQIRVPSNLTDKLGKTPIHLALGSVGLSRANKMVRLLAGPVGSGSHHQSCTLFTEQPVITVDCG